jgi:hypothetical protein
MIPRGREKLMDPADDLDVVPVARADPRSIQHVAQARQEARALGTVTNRE